jgi:hypothetical protein
VLCKRLSRASKYSPNNRGLRGQPCFTLCWHLKLDVTPSLGWLMRTVYPWHASPTSIVKNVPPPRGQPTHAIAFHVTQYRTPF